jgi:uncharacterized RDD family membrane protein YckC
MDPMKLLMNAQSEAWGPGNADAASLPVNGLDQHPELARLSKALQAPQAALRARLNAVILDLILLGIVSQVLASAATAPVSPSERALLFLVLEFSYFFIFELNSGRTVGKRVFHVRVVTASGAQATVPQIALRNVLRLVDALPFLYASGLISMIRTGPGRRQRIGDVAAGTTVVLDTDGKALATPRWLLPTLTLFATFVSLAVVIPIVARAGGGGAGPAPVEGAWLARAITISSAGYGNRRPSLVRWTIAHQCPAVGPCGYTLTFEVPKEAPVTANLVRSSRAWLAAFPVLSYPCGEAPGGQTLHWRQRSLIGLRFNGSGLAAEGEERDFSQSPECGTGSARRLWTARYAGPA